MDACIPVVVALQKGIVQEGNVSVWSDDFCATIEVRYGQPTRIVVGKPIDAQCIGSIVEEALADEGTKGFAIVSQSLLEYLQRTGTFEQNGHGPVYRRGGREYLVLHGNGAGKP